LIYLDHNATTPVSSAARARLASLSELAFGNPSSLHPAGVAARSAVDRGRAEIATVLGARSGEIVFTGGGTEADVTAVWTMVWEGRARRERARIAYLSVEHPAIRAAIAQAEELGLAVGVEVGVTTSGQVDLASLDAACATPLDGLCVMAANNETGVVTDLEAVAARVREHGVYWHCDAVQAAGKVPVRVMEGGLSAARTVALAGHKLGAPKGVGALYVRRATQIKPLLPGGKQESGRRSGTHAVGAIAAFGAAALWACGSFVPEPLEGQVRDIASIAALRDRLEGALTQIPGTVVHGRAEPRLPNTSNVALRTPTGAWADGEALMLGLSRAGIAVSTGAACAQGSRKPSAVLTAMGVSSAEAAATLRLSLGDGNTVREVDEVLRVLHTLLSHG
jgi:cysteine desulfurase